MRVLYFSFREIHRKQVVFFHDLYLIFKFTLFWVIFHWRIFILIMTRWVLLVVTWSTWLHELIQFIMIFLQLKLWNLFTLWDTITLIFNTVFLFHAYIPSQVNWFTIKLFLFIWRITTREFSILFLLWFKFRLWAFIRRFKIFLDWKLTSTFFESWCLL
jgi:hypothetical protein